MIHVYITCSSTKNTHEEFVKCQLPIWFMFSYLILYECTLDLALTTGFCMTTSLLRVSLTCNIASGVEIMPPHRVTLARARELAHRTTSSCSIWSAIARIWGLLILMARIKSWGTSWLVYYIVYWIRMKFFYANNVSIVICNIFFLIFTLYFFCMANRRNKRLTLRSWISLFCSLSWYLFSASSCCSSAIFPDWFCIKLLSSRKQLWSWNVISKTVT